MKEYRYTITIHKPQADVFETLMDKSVYPEWAKAWGEGMTYRGEWKKGEHISFVDKTQGGTKALVEDLQSPDFIKLKHVAMVNPQGEEVPLSDDMMKKWIGTLEQYFLRRLADDQTQLEIVLQMDEAFQEMMDGAWPKALQYLKDLCER